MNDLSTCKKNILEIYNSKIINYNDKIKLVFFFIIHWIFTFAIITYLLWDNEKTDKYYIGIIVILVISWTFFDNNCAISFYEKKIIKDIINTEYMYNPSLNFYCYHNTNTLLNELIIFILLIFNIGYIMLKNNIPKNIIFISLFILLVYVINIKFTTHKIYFTVK
jgi:hypothetical protein